MFPPVIDSLIDARSSDTYAILRLLRKEIPTLIPKKLPLLALGIEEQYGGALQIYKNIEFDPTVVKRKIIGDKVTFRPTLATLKKFKLPERVTVTQYLKTSRRLKLTSFLSRYLKLKGQLKDSEIRDLANKISCELYKNSFKVIYCRTLQDHIDLYTKVHAQSCMSPKTGYFDYRTRLKTHLLKKYGFWPSMWYYYNPHTRGVVLQVGRRWVARTILTRANPKGKFTYFYTIYAESRIYHLMLKDILEKKGLSSSSYVSKVCITSVFKIPAINVFKEPICPLAFHDCIAGGYACSYNKKDNAFYFGPREKIRGTISTIWGAYEFNGYITSKIQPAHHVITNRSIENDK